CDYELHEHIEPVGDDRRGSSREEGDRARAFGQALREDEPCAGVTRRDALSRSGRPYALSREARLLLGRLRLYYVHRRVWPSPDEVNEAMGRSISKDMYTTEYGKILEGDRFWKTMPSPTGLSYQWDPNSTYVQEPPFFQSFSATPPATIPDIVGARVLVSV